jgi:polynucleotide 5'-kinase involved in rRNA processing
VRVVEEGLRETLEWLRLGERLREEGAGRVLVVGPVEAGKSTLTLFLANMLRVGVVEADVGQNEIGFPACVSYASWSEPVLSLEEMGSRGCIFVGHVSAEKVAASVVAAAVEAGVRLGRFVADTDGYVDGMGAYYKAWLAEALGVDAVVALGAPRGLVEALRGRGLRVYTAPRAPLPRWRSRVDRRSYRSRLWARLFANPVSLVLEGFPVEPLCGYTVAADGGEVVYTCGGVAVVESRSRPSLPGARWVKPGWARGLVAGLRSGGGDVPAVVESLDPARGRIVVRAAWRPGEVTGVRLGWVRLSENYEEQHVPVDVYPLAVLQQRRGRGLAPPSRRGGRG